MRTEAPEPADSHASAARPSSEPAPWTWLSALLAPLVLSAGFTLGAAQQEPAFDSTVDTISALAGLAAHDRWIMSSALVLLGACHVATALGLRRAAGPGRLVLAVGGVATALVAAFPLPLEGPATGHAITALICFVSMCAWPLFAFRRAHELPDATSLLRARPSVVASLSMFALLAWFGIAVRSGDYAGLSERVLAIVQSLWPLAVVLKTRERSLARSRTRARASTHPR